MKSKKPKKHGYGYHADRAIDALVATSTCLVGDTKQARELILALCDQAGAPIEIQRAITELLRRPRSSARCPNCASAAHAHCAWKESP